MNNVYLQFSFQNTIGLLKERFLPSLTIQQKKTIAVACLAFSCLVVILVKCYLIFKNHKISKLSQQNNNKKVATEVRELTYDKLNPIFRGL